VEEKIAAEWKASAEIIKEKVTRRSEQPLGRILTPQEEGYLFQKRKSPQYSPSDRDQQEQATKKKEEIIKELKSAIEESLKKAGEEKAINDQQPTTNN